MDNSLAAEPPEKLDGELDEQAELSTRGVQKHLPSDAVLLEAYVESGCKQSLEQVIRRYAPMVASVCRLAVNDPTMAEDAFQATFLVLMKSAAKIRRRDSLAAWLHGVAYRCATQVRRQRKGGSGNVKVTELQDEDQLAMSSGASGYLSNGMSSDPVAEVTRKQELETLDRELETLPEKLRSALVEHYLLGFSAPQIAERMKLSLSAVEGRLRRGRELLRKRLTRCGVSLSVLAAANSHIEEAAMAEEAAAWTTDFVAANLVDTIGLDGAAVPNACDPIVSKVLQSEISMFHTVWFRSAAAAICILGCGSLVAILNAQSGGLRPGGLNAGGGLGQTPNSPSQAARGEVGSTVAQGYTEPKVGKNQANTGSGAGDAIAWERPTDEQNTEPTWLAGGRASMQAIERNRMILAEELKPEFKNVPLTELVEMLTEKMGVKFELNMAELELLGIDPETIVSCESPYPTSVREVIRRICEPLELTYRITESTIEITSQDAADEESNLRFYDLAYVLPNSANANSLQSAIELSINPDSWIAAGGTSSITLVGSMMIVNAPDTTHQQIEVILLNILRMNPKNAAQAPQVGRPLGGMGGGMGGMGGGAGGMGGGMF